MIMKTRSYTVIYEEDPEGGFVASVPALPGCYSQGGTLEETKRNITEAIELYLESLQDERQTLPTERIWQGRVEVSV
jgi:predicted RNase H-like HicB family nuclease